MPPTPDLIGRVFGRLVVLEKIGPRLRSRATHWLCRCGCGRESPVDTHRLVAGITLQCRACGLAQSGRRLAEANNRPLGERPCGSCGAPTPFTTAQLNRSSYCSLVCRNRAASARKRGGPAAPLEKLACETCGRVYRPVKRIQRFCSARCGRIGNAVARAKTPAPTLNEIRTELEGKLDGR